MTCGPPSQSAERPPHTSTGTNGGVPPVSTPLETEDEFGTTTPDTVSQKEFQVKSRDDHQATTDQATYSDDATLSVRPERILASLAAIPKPGGEDSSDERADTSFLVKYSDHIASHKNPFTGVVHQLINAITVVAFLAAVTLPFLYLPILLFGALDSTQFTAVMLLVGLHAISLAIGYQYEPRQPFHSD